MEIEPMKYFIKYNLCFFSSHELVLFFTRKPKINFTQLPNPPQKNK